MSWWEWNRARWLPVPERPPSAPHPEVTVHVHTTTVTATRRLLHEAAQHGDEIDRAGALFALGCAGPIEGGLPLLAAALDDPSPAVRSTALLGLGEHGGAPARFLLVQAMDAARPLSERQLAALAFGMAAKSDGLGDSTELRRLARNSAEPGLRDALCAADLLLAGDVLAEIAAGWLAAGKERATMAMACAAPVQAPCDLAAALRALLTKGPDALRLCAHELAVERGALSPTELQQALRGAAPVQRAHTVLASVAHPEFGSLVKDGFADPALRAVWALGYAVHAQASGRADVVEVLRAASLRQHNLAEPPFWLLAQQIAGDSTAPVRARLALNDGRADPALRLAAVDVLGMAGGQALPYLREILLGDADAAVRERAADVLARRGDEADAELLCRALARAGGDRERAALLGRLGRVAAPAARVALLRACGDRGAAPAVREHAWSGLARQLRPRGASELAGLPHGCAFAWLPAWLLRLVDHQR